MWKPHPKHGRPSTYQITARAQRFLRGLGYAVPQLGDEAEISDDLCRPLRKLGDLHFQNEERLGNVELTDVNKISQTFGRQLSEDEETALRAYIESHPRFDNNAEKLEEELAKLPDSTDINIDLEVDNSNDGPADTVDVDVEKLLDNKNTYFSEEIQKTLKEWEPSWVDAENEKLEKVAKKEDLPMTTEEFREAVADIPNAADSIIEMRDEQNRGVKSIYISEGEALQFSFEWYQTNYGCDWSPLVTDGRYTGRKDTDLEFQFMPVVSDSQADLERHVEHEIKIDDHQFTSWEIKIDGTSIPLGRSDNILSNAEFHRVLHDQATLLGAVESFIQELSEYDIGQPSEWLNSP